MKILIESRGGLIDFVYSDGNPQVTLLDWDEVEAAEAGEDMASPTVDFPVNSLEDILPATMEVIKKYSHREKP